MHCIALQPCSTQHSRPCVRSPLLACSLLLEGFNSLSQRLLLVANDLVQHFLPALVELEVGQSLDLQLLSKLLQGIFRSIKLGKHHLGVLLLSNMAKAVSPSCQLLLHALPMTVCHAEDNSLR